MSTAWHQPDLALARPDTGPTCHWPNLTLAQPDTGPTWHWPDLPPRTEQRFPPVKRRAWSGSIGPFHGPLPHHCGGLPYLCNRPADSAHICRLAPATPTNAPTPARPDRKPSRLPPPRPDAAANALTRPPSPRLANRPRRAPLLPAQPGCRPLRSPLSPDATSLPLPDPHAAIDLPARRPIAQPTTKAQVHPFPLGPARALRHPAPAPTR